MGEHSAPETGTVVSNRMYDALKYLAQFILPAIQAFFLTTSKIWEFDVEGKVTATIAAINVLVGVFVTVVGKIYNNSDQKFDGEMQVTPPESDIPFRLVFNSELEDMDKKREVVLKVVSK